MGGSAVGPNSTVDHFHHYAYLPGGSKKRQSFMHLLWFATVWVIWQRKK
jgi:hypothetical protein